MLHVGTIALLDDEGDDEKAAAAAATVADDNEDDDGPVHLTLDDSESAEAALARARNVQRRGSAGSVVCTLSMVATRRVVFCVCDVWIRIVFFFCQKIHLLTQTHPYTHREKMQSFLSLGKRCSVFCYPLGRDATCAQSCSACVELTKDAYNRASILDDTKRQGVGVHANFAAESVV